MQIHKVTYPVSALQAMPPAQRSAFLLLGHFLNEANWLQKLILYSTLDESGHEAERQARLALSLMVSKVFAAKIHEGWVRLTTGELGATVAELTLSPDVERIRADLKEHLRPDSILHKIRRDLAFHYPTSLSLDGLPGISDGDAALYMSAHAGDTISLIGELSAAAELNAVVGSDHLGESLGAVLDEVVKVSALYSDFLHASLVALTDLSLKGAPTHEIIGNEDAMPLEDVRLRFFVTPPGTPTAA